MSVVTARRTKKGNSKRQALGAEPSWPPTISLRKSFRESLLVTNLRYDSKRDDGLCVFSLGSSFGFLEPQRLKSIHFPHNGLETVFALL